MMAQEIFTEPHTFVPTPENTKSLRDAFGRFATGVTVVTVDSEDGPVGITANSFSSVSLDPALVLWSPSVRSRRYPYFAAADHFAIHVLSDEQAHICNGFAGSPFAFDAIDYHKNAHGVPLINHCLARFECKRTAIHPGGDHAIVVGEIETAEMRDGEALAFFAGKFGSFAAK